MRIDELLNEESYLDKIKRAFDWSGEEEFEAYLKHARRFIEIHPPKILYKRMLKSFPKAKPVDIKRAIQQVQKERGHRI